MFEDVFKGIDDTTPTTNKPASNDVPATTQSTEPEVFEDFEDYEPAEPPQYVEDTEPELVRETPKGKSAQEPEESGHVEHQETGQQTATKGNKETMLQSDRLHSLGFHTASDFFNDTAPVDYLIDNIIQREAYHQVFGASGNGKSFVVLDMAATIAYSGIDEWFHKPVEHGDVIYFVGEGSKGMKKRVRLWCQMHKANPEDVRIFFHDLPFKLDGEGQAEEIIKAVREISSKPALIIFDTLNVYMAGDENSNTDAGKFNFACTQIIKELHTAVLTVHHTGKGEETKKQSRGASAFHAALDIEFRVEKDNDVITLIQTKNKDNEEEKPLLFNLKQYELQGVTDKYGQPVTSCVVYPAEQLMHKREAMEAEQREEATRPKFTASQNFAFTSYYMAAAEHGELVVDDDTTGHAVICVDVEDWRKIFKANATQDNNKAKNEAFKRAREYFTKAKDLTKPGIAIIQRTEGHEFYVMDLSNEAIPAKFRAEIREAIETRKQSPAAEATGSGDATGNLF